MKPNPILDELWKVEDQLAAKAGYDVDRFLENLRRWEAEYPHGRRVIHTAEEERKQAEAAALSLKGEPPRQG